MKILIAVFALVMAGHVSGAESFLNESERAKLSPNPEVPGVENYITPGFSPGNYNKLLYGSVTLYFSDSSKSKDIDAEEAKAISDAMKAALVKAVASGAGEMEVVETPGPATALLNVAITEINMQNKKRGLLGYTPVGLVATAAGNLAGMRMELRDAKIEGELVDSVSGEVIAIFRVEEIPAKKGEKSRSWDDVTTIFEKFLKEGIATSRD